MGRHLGDAGLTKPKVPLIGHISCCLGQTSPVPGTFPPRTGSCSVHPQQPVFPLFLPLRLMSAYYASGTEKGAQEEPQ